MIRVRDLDATLQFFCEGLGLREVRRMDNAAGKFTLIFLSAPETPEAEIELTHNWGSDEDYGCGAQLRPSRLRASTTSTRPARICRRWASRSTGRRATATWPSCARRT